MVGIGYVVLIPLLFVLPILPLDLVINAFLVFFALLESQFAPHVESSLWESLRALIAHLSQDL